MSQSPEFGYIPERVHAETFVRATFLENFNIEENKRPDLEIQGGELNHWQHLVDTLAGQLKQGKPAVVSLVRCWGKDTKALGELADRFSKNQADFPELFAPMISVNATLESEKGYKDHMTTKSIQNARAEKNFPAVTLEVKNCTWTSGLNGPTALLHYLLVQKGITPEQLQKMYILNQSFDVEMDSEMCKKLSEAVQKGKYVLTIREEDGMYADHPEKKVELSDKVKKVMKTPNLLNNPDFVRELARVGRNTGMLISMSDIIEMGGFDNTCNGLGGMEDHDLYMRLLLKELDGVRRGKGPSNRLKKMIRAFAEPLVYNDRAWNKTLAEGKQEPKVLAEGSAVQKISENIQKRWENAVGPESYITALENRDFVFVV